jgi:hypothetical protein
MLEMLPAGQCMCAGAAENRVLQGWCTRLKRADMGCSWANNTADFHRRRLAARVGCPQTPSHLLLHPAGLQTTVRPMLHAVPAPRSWPACAPNSSASLLPGAYQPACTTAAHRIQHAQVWRDKQIFHNMPFVTSTGFNCDRAPNLLRCMTMDASRFGRSMRTSTAGKRHSDIWRNVVSRGRGCSSLSPRLTVPQGPKLSL